MDKSLKEVDITKVLFLDIETVPQYKSYILLPKYERELWDKKAKRLRDVETTSPSQRYKRAGIFAEFGKIVCISVAYVRIIKGEPKVRVTSFFGDNEKQILEDFLNLIYKHFNSKNTYYCAHNGKEFDMPYIARRLLINGLEIPNSLDTRGLKPWEVKHIDTMEMWKFGDYKNYSSLSLLTHIFGIPSPKNDIDGSMVCDIYWQNHDLERIARYCEKDVVAILHLFRKYRIEDIIPDESITFVKN